MRRTNGGLGATLLVVALILGACSNAANPIVSQAQTQVTVTRTPFQPVRLTATPVPSLTPTRPAVAGIWAEASVPDELRHAVQLPDGQAWQWVDDPAQALLRLRRAKAGENVAARWVYALVAPFPTVTDGISLDGLKNLWRGERGEVQKGKLLLVSESTRRVFEAIWGGASTESVQVMAQDQILNQTYNLGAWALVPFDDLQPRWKVLQVDGKSPLGRGTLGDDYPLAAAYHLEALPAGEQQAFEADGGVLPKTNRDPKRMTVVVMTGTTALARAVGWKMETLGMTYPAQDIAAWMRDADFTHVSSESSFNPKCPAADPMQKSLMFCSRPEYIQLFEAAGVNLIELTGNHNSDWGKDGFSYSLELFRQHGWQWFGGGKNAKEAAQPLLIEHNGNKLAFIGCNLPGPPDAWATADEPGAARCKLDALEKELGGLRSEGYLPIMTFQYNEIYVPYPSEGQARDFKRMADAGAAIVSGSQAHFPQGFAFENGNFIHYGLGNLFFDQMDVPVVGTRREFLDRHVFYNGKYISTEVLTAMLEDYSRPRPMTAAERAAFLTELFKATKW